MVAEGGPDLKCGPGGDWWKLTRGPPPWSKPLGFWWQPACADYSAPFQFDPMSFQNVTRRGAFGTAPSAAQQCLPCGVDRFLEIQQYPPCGRGCPLEIQQYPPCGGRRPPRRNNAYPAAGLAPLRYNNTHPAAGDALLRYNNTHPAADSAPRGATMPTLRRGTLP